MVDRADESGREKQAVRLIAQGLPDGDVLVIGRNVDEVGEIARVVGRALALGLAPAVLVCLAIGVALSARARKRIVEVSERVQPRPSFPDIRLSCSNRLSRRTTCTIDDICDLPPSPEGAIKIDEVCRDLRVAVGKIIFALQQLGLCRNDIQEVDRTLRVTLPGGSQSGLIFSDGPGDIGTPVLRFAIGRQGVVDLLPGPQDRFLKENGCLPLS